MSEQSVARWNAIPLTRPDTDPEYHPSLKRPHEDDDNAPMDGEESDDDISLVSRSPSPRPKDAMDVDKYDEYVPGSVREVITVETKIKDSNKGFAMLAKLGWTEGQPLGLSGDGRVEPVPFYVKRDLTGLGKTNQDVRMIEETVSQRRELDSERQQKETEEQRLARENSVARRVAVQSEISETLRPFYCNVCDKQFQNVAQYDEHTNSYAHHHKVRFRDMQMAQRQKQNTEEELSRRKEKERKREEKELRKIAAAAGIKIAKPAGPTSSTPALASTSNVNANPEDTTAQALGPKKGWASVSAGASAVAVAAARPATGLRTANDANWAESSARPPAPSSSTNGWAATATYAPSQPLPSPPSIPPQASVPAQQPHGHHPAPSFRAGGWSSLETTTSTPPPPPPPLPPQPRAVPLPAPSTGGWASTSSQPLLPPPELSVPPPTHQQGWTVGQPPHSMAAPSPQSTPQEVPPSSIIVPAPALTPQASASKKGRKDAEREKGRSGWQAFQKGGRRK